jgi:ABC-type protease/lipase transport system fused ATPase/permease subunit
MAPAIAEIWEKRNADYRALNRRAADIGNALGTISKVFRLALQSAVLCVGAIVVIRGQASPGIIIAASILTSRALAPVDLSRLHRRAARLGPLARPSQAYPDAGRTASTASAASSVGGGGPG